MERRVIEIDQEECIGCGACEAACEENAIGMINGKARLVRDDYCDGLGNCIPVCPRSAIHFIIREAAPFDEAAVKRRMVERGGVSSGKKTEESAKKVPVTTPEWRGHWPVKLAMVSAADAAFDRADVLVAADCAAYACPGFQNAYMDGKTTVIGCPRFDETDVEPILEDIFRDHDINSVLVTRTYLPCCEPLEQAVRNAAQKCGKSIPLRAVALDTDGKIGD